MCWTDDWTSDPAVTYSADNAAAMVKSASARAFIAAPIILRDGVYGILMTGYTHPHTHTDADVRLMTTLAGQAAIALENARLLEVTRRREAEVAHKSALLETTLESMGQGLLAFDDELRLAALEYAERSTSCGSHRTSRGWGGPSRSSAAWSPSAASTARATRRC